MKLVRYLSVMTLFFLLPISSVFSVEAGYSAPSCELKQLVQESTAINLEQYKGKVLYLDFWASWCGPCVKSFPYMNKLESDLKSQGLQVIAVNLDEDINEAYEFLEKVPANFLLVQDSQQKCAKAFELQAMPTSYLIDRQGIVRHVHLGFRSGEVGELQSKIKQLLAE